jgi:hypothetical protein
MCYCAVDVSKMYTYTNKEYAIIDFVYGFCNGNMAAAVSEYER